MFEDKPWLRGIVENIYAADLIRNTSLENKNRICLILLDTALEVSFKYFLSFGLTKPIKVEKQWDRETLHKVVKKNTSFENDLWTKIDYFYGLRCDLYHENAGKTIMDSDLNDFYKLVLFILNDLFDIPSEAFDIEPTELIIKNKTEVFIPINKLKLLEQIIVVVKKKRPKSSSEIGIILKQMGAKKIPSTTTITAYMQNNSYKHYFHYENGTFFLTESEGEQLYNQIEERFKKQ